MKPNVLLLAALASFALTSCKDSEQSGNTGGEEADSGKSPLEAVLLETAPDGAVAILEARKNPTPGTEVIFAGKVMGKREPFSTGAALVVLGDPAVITSCDLKPGDECETPWDVCCDLPEDIKRSIVTVQVVDEAGRPVRSPLKGLGGMKELSSLVVKGTVAEGSNPDNLLVNATGIHVAMVEPATE